MTRAQAKSSGKAYPEVFNVAQFAAFVGISPTSAWRAIKTYKVPHERPLPKIVRISKVVAEDYRRTRTVTCAADERRLTDGRRRL